MVQLDLAGLEAEPESQIGNFSFHGCTGHWHSNDTPGGVTILWITPSEGNEHSWDEPTDIT